RVGGERTPRPKLCAGEEAAGSDQAAYARGMGEEGRGEVNARAKARGGGFRFPPFLNCVGSYFLLLRFREIDLRRAIQFRMALGVSLFHRRGAEGAEPAQRPSALSLRSLRLCGEWRSLYQSLQLVNFLF